MNRIMLHDVNLVKVGKVKKVADMKIQDIIILADDMRLEITLFFKE